MKNNNEQTKIKPRKHPHLWQSYQMWDELMEMRKSHNQRIKAIEREASNMDAQFERDFISDMKMDVMLETMRKTMIVYGSDVGPIWDWVTSIRGLGAGGEAAKLLAQIDDIALFPNVSKLWRFSGMAVIDGEAERSKKGEKSHYNRRLKSICWVISGLFIMTQTPTYVDIYDEEKERQRQIHPTPVCRKCGAAGVQKGLKWLCSACKAKGEELDYTPNHIEKRARRKMIKIFLQHLWLKWREFEGLPISEPYVKAILGHADIIDPPD